MDFNAIMQQARQFQEKLTAIQERLAHEQVTSTVGGGMVQATVDGTMRLVSISIDREVIDPDEQTMLQDLVVAAVNDAMTKARELAQAEMRALTGGLQIPGLF